MKRKIVDNCIYYFKDDGKTLIASADEKNDNHHCLFVLSGNISSDVAIELNEEMLTLLALKKDISVDLENVDYFSSTFVNDLISLERKVEIERGKSIVIKNMKRTIFDTLARDGFIQSLDVRVKEDSK